MLLYHSKDLIQSVWRSDVGRGPAALQILILDDDKSYGAMVASACRKLGHRASVSPSAAATVESLQNDGTDVLLLDLEMPPRTGTEIALWLRSQGYGLPIAFCTGTCQDQALIASAHDMAEVLPRVWTHADLKGILDSLEVECREQKRQCSAGSQRDSSATQHASTSFAAGTGPGARASFEGLPTEDIPAPDLPGVDLVAADLGPDHVDADPGDTIRTEAFVGAVWPELATLDHIEVDGAFAAEAQILDQVDSRSPGEDPASTPPRPSIPRVPIHCSTWPLVRRICEDARRGLRTISVHAEQTLELEQEVMVAVALPDEMVVSQRGRVRAVSRGSGQEVPIFSIELTEFGEQEIGYLLALCDVYAPAASDADGGESLHDAPADIPSTRDSVDLDAADFEDAPRISWGKPR